MDELTNTCELDSELETAISESIAAQIDCGIRNCAPPKEINEADVILEGIREPKRTSIVVGPQGLTMSSHNKILKVDELKIQEGGRIALDMEAGVEIYTIIAKVLSFESAIKNSTDLLIKRSQLHWTSLNGGDGDNAPQPTQAGADGLTGFPGKDGRTIHTPSLFVFVNQIQVDNGAVSDIQLEVTLDGVSGGKGGDGGNGSDGVNGKKGRNAESGCGGFCCDSGRGSGQDGGNAGMGGRGGNGGCGGHGGSLYMYSPDPSVRSILDSTKTDLSGARDNNEAFGEPGTAGKPGLGGPPGNSANGCSDTRGSGYDGEPQVGSWSHRNHHLGRGQASTKGKSGVFYMEKLQDTSIFD